MCEHCNEDLKETKGFNKVYKELGNNLYEELSGMKFGKLQPVKPVGRTKQSRVVWLCKCDCGKYLITDASTLKSGKGRSCGCLSAESRRENLDGKVFTRWTVLKDEGGDKVYCKCSCGTERWVDRGNLRGGGSISCGCLRKEIFHKKYKKVEVGQVYGRLTIKKLIGRNHNKKLIWEAECSCGNITTVTSDLLLKGHTRSCGCLKKEQTKERCTKPMIGKTFGRLTVVRLHHNEKGHNFYECLCSCGNTSIVDGIWLRSGNTTSCGCINSKGELKISQILSENEIVFERQKTYDDLRIGSHGIPKFDFYIPEGNYIIEYDGQQHFTYTNIGWNDEKHFKKVQERDKIKNEYCKNNNIPIIRVPYTQYDALCIDDLKLETSKFILKD